MEKDNLESLLIDYIDGKLNTVDKHKIEQELMRNASTYKLYEELKTVIHAMNQAAPIEPSERLRASFMNQLNQEIASAPKAKSIVFSPWIFKVAAAIAFVVLSVSVVYLVSRNQAQERELARIKAEHEKLMAMIGDSNSAAQRITGVRATYSSVSLDRQLTDALLKAIDEDPNTNVRLAAIEGLRRFYKDDEVRHGLLHSLSTQTDPVVQVALIQLLVELNEKAAIEPLRRMVNKTDLLPSVKDEAYIAILRLS
jgi:hypothetical protein